MQTEFGQVTLPITERSFYDQHEHVELVNACPQSRVTFGVAVEETAKDLFKGPIEDVEVGAIGDEGHPGQPIQLVGAPGSGHCHRLGEPSRSSRGHRDSGRME